MHQTKYSANSLSHIKLAIRVFFLSVLLMGNTFLFISTMASNQIFAQGTTQTGQQHMTALQPHAVASANKILHTEKHIASQAQKESMGRQPVALNSSRKTSAQAAATPLPQNLSIAANVQGGPAFQVGQTLTFVLTVTNISPTTTLDATSGVRITDLIQLGLNSITGTASSGWNIITSAPNSPSLIQATYTGASVAPGAPFPQVTISGILTSDAVPTISNTAGVADNSNPNLSFATFSVNVSPSTETVTVTPTPTTAPASNPDVNLSFNVHGGPAFQVGQTLTFDMIVTNISTTVLDATSGVSTGTFTVPGLSNITAGGSGWTVIATSQNSPTFVQGVYGGPPVPPGGTFTPFQISATLNDAAIPAYTDTGGTADTQFPNPNLATFSVSVSSAPLTPTVVVSPSPTVVVSPSPTVVVSPSPTVVVSPSPTVVISPSPTVIGTPSPTATPPQLSIASSNPGGSSYTVGQTVNYQLVVTNQPTGLAKNQPIIVQEVFPVGLTNIVATGNNWSISLSNTTSPALITATYAGFYPVAPGTILPAISISGTLTAAAGPSFTSSASVNSADDPNPNPTLNTSTQTITVLGSTASPIVTSTATPTLPGTPLSSPTATVPPTLTGTPSPSPVVAETPTLPAGATPTTIAATTPNVSIVQSHLGGNHFHVGDTVSYVLIVSTASALATPITVTDVIPLGLSHMKVVAPGWLVALSASSSPAVLTATYTGVGLIRAGQILSPIIITGVLDGDAVPSLTNSATVGTLGNSNVYNTTAIDTVFVDTSSNSNNGNSSDNNQDNSNNNDNNNQNNNNQNHNNNQNNNNQNHNNNSSNNTSFPGLPATGSDPAGA